MLTCSPSVQIELNLAHSHLHTQSTQSTPAMQASSMQACPTPQPPPRADLQWSMPLVARWYQYKYVATQMCKLAWKQLRRASTASVLAEDFEVINVLLPAINQTPRVTTGAAGATIEMFASQQPLSASIAAVQRLLAQPRQRLLNAASYSYSGFNELSDDTIRLLQYCLESLPFCNRPSAELSPLDIQLHMALQQFNDYPYSTLTPSGYTMNLIAIPAIARCYSKMILVLDRAAHNSMLVGAYLAKAPIIKFHHNSVQALKQVLEQARQQEPKAQLLVAIESIYSTTGDMCPLPEILALKREYGFLLYIDEAHSWLAMGSRGQGVVEWFRERGHNMHASDVDVTCVTLSKAAATLGGCVFTNNATLHDSIRSAAKSSERDAGDVLPNVVKVRLLDLLSQPDVIASRTASLQAASLYVSSQLRQAGLQVTNVPGSPTISFLTGTLPTAMQFVRIARSLGVMALGIGPPAVEAGRAVVCLRICAGFTPTQLQQMVTIVLQACRELHWPLRRDAAAGVAELPAHAPEHGAHHPEIMAIIDREAMQNKLTDKSMLPLPSNLIAIGAAALRQYGVGACAPRWFVGTYDVHLRLELAIARLYPSLTQAYGECKAVVYPVGCSATTSTLTCLIRPVAARAQHHVVLYDSKSTLMADAVQAASPHKRVTCVPCKAPLAVDDVLKIASITTKSFHLTIGITAGVRIFNDVAGVVSVVKQCIDAGQRIRGVTLMLHDTVFGQHPSSYVHDTMPTVNQLLHARTSFQQLILPLGVPCRTVVSASLHRLGVTGGFAVGDLHTMQIISWHSRAYMFTAAPLPVTMAVALPIVEQLQQCDITRGQTHTRAGRSVKLTY